MYPIRTGLQGCQLPEWQPFFYHAAGSAFPPRPIRGIVAVRNRGFRLYGALLGDFRI
jgi:hypothetical protein